jgi:hypothetical protein
MCNFIMYLTRKEGEDGVWQQQRREMMEFGG